MHQNPFFRIFVMTKSLIRSRFVDQRAEPCQGLLSKEPNPRKGLLIDEGKTKESPGALSPLPLPALSLSLLRNFAHVFSHSTEFSQFLQSSQALVLSTSLKPYFALRINKLQLGKLNQVTVESLSYHKSCFKCSHGGCSITPSNYAALEGILYYKHHFSQLFKEKGSYNHLLKSASMKRPTASVPEA